MPKVTVKKEITYVVELSEEEVRFLAGMLQNSLYDPMSTEPIQERTMRESIFMALTERK